MLHNLKPGAILGNRYELLYQIGAGGMGTVFKGKDLEGNNDVAIKILNYKGPVKENEIRFRREFRVISRCDHPHVISVFDFGTDGEILYFVMEFIIGKDMREFMINKLLKDGIVNFDLNLYIDIFLQVCDALDFIHSQKIIHRDIKPENILIDQNNSVKIMDFGLSRVIDASGFITQTGEVMGTAAYISPEQGRGTKIDLRTDIYSLGICMFEAATGVLPFTGTNPISLVFQHIQNIPKSPLTYNKKLPKRIEEIILKSMQKDPFDRYQRANEIIDDLKKAINEVEDAEENTEQKSCFDLFTSFVKRPDFLLDAAFINRKEAMSQIHEMMIDVKNSRGNTLLLEGETGIGKTRLIKETILHTKKFIKRNALLMVRGNCTEEEYVPYKPIIEGLRELLKQSDIVQQGIFAQGANSWGRALVKLMPELEKFFPETLQKENISDIDSAIAQEQIKKFLYQGIYQFIKIITRYKPVMFIIDNLQWADNASLDIFQYLMHETNKIPLLLIGIYRTGELGEDFEKLLQKKHKSSGSFSARKLRLKPLKTSLVKKMIESMLGSPYVSQPDFFDKIQVISSGNPFFIEEILKSYLSEGKIYRKEGKWEIEVDTVNEMNIPSSIRELVIKKLLNFSENQQRLLEFIAILANEFDISILMGLLDTSEKEIYNDIDEMVRADILIQNENTFNEKYTFKNATIQEILLKRIPRRKKMFLHERVAEQLEELYYDQKDIIIDQLANHYKQSRNKAKALRYLILAAEKAESIFAHDSALKYFKQALRIVQQEGEFYLNYTEQRIMREIAQLYLLHGEHKAALNIIKKALILSEDLLDLNETVQLLMIKAMIYYHISDYVKSLEFWENASVVVRRIQDKNNHAKILDNIGLVCLNLGQYEQAEEYIQQSLQINEEGYFTEGQAQNLKHLGIIYDTKGQLKKSLEHYEKSLQLMEQIENKLGVAEGLGAIGSVYASMGHFTEALQYHEKALTMAKPLGNFNMSCQEFINSGLASFYIADFSKAIFHLKNAKAIAEEINEKKLLILSAGNLSIVYAHLNMLNKAAKLVNITLDLIKETGNRSLEAWIYSSFATITLKQGNYQYALKLANISLEKAKTSGENKNLLFSLIVMMKIHYELFQNKEAKRFALQTIELAHDIGNDFSLMLGELFLCNISLRSNSINSAEKHLKNVENTFPLVHANDYLWRILNTKARLLLQKDNVQEALDTLQIASVKLETIFKTLKEQDLREAYAENKDRLGLYAFYISLLLHNGNDSEAVQVLLSASSETLKKLLFKKNKETWNKDFINGFLKFEQNNILF